MNSAQLRSSLRQHGAKNKHSDKQDKIIAQANYWLVDTLNQEYKDKDIIFRRDKKISYPKMIEKAINGTTRIHDKQFNNEDRNIAPDGGVIWMKYKDEEYPILISETKRQGTNDAREDEGLAKQAQGNAIERLGKNLTAIKVFYSREKITPFVIFGQGWDFKEDQNFVLAKLSALNEFYPLNTNRIEKDYISFDNDNHFVFSPCPFYFRYKEWEFEEISEKLYKVAEKSISYFLGDDNE